MFTKAEVRNSNGDLLTLQLGDPSNGVNLMEIAGLDPVKATLSSTNFANQDGAVYQSSRREARNITFKLGIDPDPATSTVRSVRKSITNMFRPTSEVRLKFFADDQDDNVEDGYYIVGRVESCDSPMFAQESIVDISVMCYDPDFVDPIPVTITGMTTADVSPTVIPYLGSVESGFTFSVNVNRTLSAFTLYYTDPTSTIWKMDFAASLLTGDVVTISTIPGNKYASLLRAGVTSSILYGVSAQSIWPELAPGTNSLKVQAAGAAIPVTVTYSNRYGEL